MNLTILGHSLVNLRRDEHRVVTKLVIEGIVLNARVAGRFLSNVRKSLEKQFTPTCSRPQLLRNGCFARKLDASQEQSFLFVAKHGQKLFHPLLSSTFSKLNRSARSVCRFTCTR